MRTKLVFVLTCGIVAAGPAWGMPEVPSPVSPGSAEGVALLSGGCPTFLWGGVEGAVAYELVVYRVQEAAQDGGLQPVLRLTLPGSAPGWVPSLDQCLGAGGRYAWSVRALGKGQAVGEWSEPRLFEVAAGPRMAEVQEAMEVLRRYTRTRRDTLHKDVGATPEARDRQGREEAAAEGLLLRPAKVKDAGRRHENPTPLSSPTLGAIAAAAAPTLGTASLTVDQQIHLGVASNFFKDGDLFLWDDEVGGNTALGRSALRLTTGTMVSGHSNTAVGRLALANNTTGLGNTAVGLRGLIRNHGSRNTGIGWRVLAQNDTGCCNTASGAFALYKNTGSYNVAIGHEAGNEATTGDHNVFIAHEGAAADDGVIRIGTLGVQTIASIAGDLGLGTESPGNRLHVKDDINGVATPGNHVALIENISTGSSPDVLALKVGRTGAVNIGAGINFLTFIDGADASLGAIQGTGAGVTLAGPGNDYAEWLPRLDPGEALAPGDVVGLYEGKVTRATRGAQRLMVLSTGPIVSGNDPGEARRPLYARVAFVGQVEVRVRGPVSAGDLVVGSGQEDGTAVAVAPERFEIDQVPWIVGRALKAAPGEGLKKVRVMVGVADPEPLYRLLQPPSSTRRHKQAIREMGEASSGLLALRPVSFRYKPGVFEGPRPLEFGLLAEEVAQLYPDLVTYDEEGLPYGVRYQVLIPMLLNELQKQHAEFRKQRAELQKQHAEVEALRRRLARLERRDKRSP